METKKTIKKIDTLITSLLSEFDEEYTAKMGTDFEVNLDTKIVYWSLLYPEKSGQSFYDNFCSRFPIVKTLSIFTLSLFHEIGHIETEDEMIDDTDIRNTHLSAEEYFNLFNEKIATDWAGNFIENNFARVEKFDDSIFEIIYSFYDTLLDS